jgi:hypothetical protein
MQLYNAFSANKLKVRIFYSYLTYRTPQPEYSISGVPNLGDASPWGDLRGMKVVVTWVHLYQCGDAIDVRGDGRAKRLGFPVIYFIEMS